MNADESPGLMQLTGRQMDCVALVAQGLSSKEVGRTLGISPSTVDNHVAAAMRQFGFGNRLALARWYQQQQAQQTPPGRPERPAPANPPDWREQPERRVQQSSPVGGTGDRRGSDSLTSGLRSLPPELTRYLSPFQSGPSAFALLCMMVGMILLLSALTIFAFGLIMIWSRLF